MPSLRAEACPVTIALEATEAAVAAAWRQWSILGASGGPARDDSNGAATVIDPEALVLASLTLSPAERRLADFLVWWAGVGASLLSVQRTRALLPSMPDAARDGLPAFAASAVAAGDRRWKRLAGETALDARPGKGAERPELRHPAALLLRLRAGFGVSAKADLLAVLAGVPAPLPVRDLAEAVGYSTVTARVALGDMTLAGFARATDRHPASYLLGRPAAWSKLITPGQPLPRWGHWAEAFAALLAIAEWGRKADAAGWSDYVASSKARDLVEAHAATFRRLAPDTPPLEDYRGTDALPVFAATARTLAQAVANHRPEQGA